MKLNIFKGLNKSLARKVSKEIDKPSFLEELADAWYPHISKNSDIEIELVKAKERISKSGFETVFKEVGITDSDLREVLTRIQSEKPETAHREVTKVGRNDPCPCNSGLKYKKCCGK